jgi:hypothetical protein
MPELLDAFHDMLEHPPTPVTPLADIEHRARALRRQRLARKLAAIPVLAAVVAVTIVATSSRTHNQRVVTGPAPAAPQAGGLAPLPVKMIPGPPGWQPVDYGNARVWVPGDWTIYANHVPCDWFTNGVVLNANFNELCPVGSGIGEAVPSYALMQPVSNPMAAQHSSRYVNGYLVKGDAIYVVPDLSVQLTLVGPESNAILATLGPSSRDAVLAPGAAPPAPPTWQTVSYGSLTVRVPSDWPIKEGSTFTGGCVGSLHASRATVVLDCLISTDTLTFPPRDGIWLLKYPLASNNPPGTIASNYPDEASTPLTTTSGLHVGIFKAASTDNNYLIGLYAFPQGTEVQMVLGLGANPIIARTILYSLSTSPPAAPQPSNPALTSALARWADFPVLANPRPIVLTGDRVVGPALGFKTDQAKEAFSEGMFVSPAALPATPSSANGYPLVTASDAYAILHGEGTPIKGSPDTVPPLTITGVRLGTASFSTDRGWQTLPAWLFTFAGVQNPAAVLAVSPTGIYTQALPSNPATIGATLGGDGQTLTVTFAGAPPGSGPCTANYTAEVAESATAVAVEINAIPQTATTDSQIACAGVAYDRQVIVTLASPLGGRVLVDDMGHPARVIHA